MTMDGHFHLTDAAGFHYSFGRSLTAFKDMVPVSIGRRSFLSAALLAFAMTSQGRAQVGTAEAATGPPWPRPPPICAGLPTI